MNANTIDRTPSRAYANETNGLVDAAAYHTRMHTDSVDMTLAQLGAARGRVTRLRLLSDRGCPWVDVSYCHGVLPDGTPVRVTDAPTGLNLRGLKGDLIAWARESGVYAKGMGLLDEGNWSHLR